MVKELNEQKADKKPSWLKRAAYAVVGIISLPVVFLTGSRLVNPKDGQDFAERIQLKSAAPIPASAPISEAETGLLDVKELSSNLERKLSGNNLAMYVFRNLDFAVVDFSSPAQKERYLKAQFKFFMSELKKRNSHLNDEEIAGLLRQDGSKVDLAEGTYETVYLATGQAIPLELKINGVVAGNFQIIKNGAIALETAKITGNVTPQEINIAGLSVNPLNVLAALNWDAFTGKPEEVANGVYTHFAALGAAIANKPRIVGLTEVDRVSFCVLNTDFPALDNLGYIPKGSASFPNSDEIIRGLRAGDHLGVVHLSKEQLRALGETAKSNLPEGLNNKELPKKESGLQR